MGRKNKYPSAGKPMVFELPASLQGDPDQPTRIHWTAPSVSQRREHHAMRGAAIGGDGREWAAYQAKIVEDVVTAVENYEDDDGQPVTTMEGLLEHGEPDVIAVFVEHVHNNSAMKGEEKKDSSPPSGSSTTGTSHGTDGTTPAAPGSSGPVSNKSEHGELAKQNGVAAAAA
jgi:hypothetical protein